MKNKLFAVPIFFAAMVMALALPAHAAGQAKIPLPKDDAFILQQALDVLKSILDQLSARVDSGDEVVWGNAESINARLTDMRGELAALHTTLLAFSEQHQPVAVRQEPVAYPATAQFSEGASLVSPPSPPSAFQGTLPRDAISGAPVAAASAGQLAVASNRVSATEITWLGLFVLAVVGVVWRFRTGGQIEAPVVAAKILPEKGTETWPGVADIDWS